jgi:hypothetical protein
MSTARSAFTRRTRKVDGKVTKGAKSAWAPFKKRSVRMSIQTRKRLLAYLAGATFSVAPGAEGVLIEDISTVPESFLGDILDEAEGGTWDSEDRLALLKVLAEDGRPSVRARVLKVINEARPKIPLEAFEPVLLRIAENAPPEVLRAMAALVGTSLNESDGFTRTRVVSEWALSESPGVRNVIARVLGSQFLCVGSLSAASHLAQDPDPDVRTAIRPAGRCLKHWS